MPTLVIKLGSSVLGSEEDLPRAVQEIYRWVRDGWRVVAVVSAFAGRTDALLHRAGPWAEDAPCDAIARLVATGETEASTLLALALERAGLPCVVKEAGELGLKTTPGLDAHPLPEAAIRLPDGPPVVVVPGFAGRDVNGDVSLLGRGGSDLTAVFLAVSLGARCRLLKDTGGIYTADPRRRPDARCFARVSWAEAGTCAGGAVQPRALELARAHGLQLEIARPGDRGGTWIGPCEAPATADEGTGAPLRVAVLGCGTVGGGVIEEILRYPRRFALVAVGVRHPARASVPQACGVDEAVARPSDVVVELLGGIEPATSLVERALRTGRAVVTANKAVVAQHGARLAMLGPLRYGASVGGAVPVLETLRTIEGIESVHGVINTTSQFVLRRLEEGADLGTAVADARGAGLAEADPTLDLDGSDAAHKLAVIARVAWGREVVAGWIPREPITPNVDRGVRQIATIDRRGRASVALRQLPPSSPLRVGPRDNVVVIRRRSGPDVVLRGRGAGRWPTTLAVVADLFQLARAHQRVASAS